MSIEAVNAPAPTPEQTANLSAALEGGAPAGASSTPAAPASDAKPEVPKESASAAYQAIIREKKKLLEDQKRAREEREAVTRERSEIDEYRKQLAQAKTSPIAALQAAGWSYKDATDFVLNNEQMTPEQQIAAVRDELKRDREDRDAKEQKVAEEARQAAEAAQTQAITDFKEQIGAFVTADADAYELINTYEQAELVFATVAAHFEKTQKILSIKEASDLVEAHLEEELFGKALKTKKFQSKHAPKPPEAPKSDAPSAPKTLTNAMSGSAAPKSPARSEQERYDRALAALDALKK